MGRQAIDWGPTQKTRGGSELFGVSFVARIRERGTRLNAKNVSQELRAAEEIEEVRGMLNVQGTNYCSTINIIISSSGRWATCPLKGGGSNHRGGAEEVKKEGGARQERGTKS